VRALLPMCLLLVAAPAAAEEDFFDPVALGMGGAGRILPVDASVLRLNPASMAIKPNYAGGSSYGFYGREKAHTWSSGAADSYTSEFALGTNYTMRIYEPPFDPTTDLNWYPAEGADELQDKRTMHRWDISAAYGLLQRRINVGLGGRLVNQRYEIRENRTFFTLDTGVTGAPTRWLFLAFSAQNLIPTKDSRFPTRLSAGAAVDFDQSWEQPFSFKAEVDVVWDMTSQVKPVTDLHGGAEIRFLRFVAIRGGYYSDRKFLDNYVTWGLGFHTPKFHVNYGMRIEVGPVDKRIRSDRELNPQRILWNVGFLVRFP
jgi:hypothetical protein